jgi:hypothetical protein
MEFKLWSLFLIFLSVSKVLSFINLPSVLTGGFQTLCDCEIRSYQSPLHQHSHGFGAWFHALIWLHFLIGFGIVIPVLIALISTKGSPLHIRSGQVYLICWIIQIFFGIIVGGIAMLTRGPVPGEDKATGGHYWETFPFTIYILFSFVLSTACEQLANGTAAIQFKEQNPSKLVHYTFLFGSFITILHGLNILAFGTTILGGHPEPGSSQAFFPWLYYVFIPIEMVMAVLNIKYWLSEVEDRNWLFQHLRCMIWSAFLTFFFVFENLTFKIISTYGVTRWLLLPVWIVLVAVFVFFIWWNKKQID